MHRCLGLYWNFDLNRLPFLYQSRTCYFLLHAFLSLLLLLLLLLFVLNFVSSFRLYDETKHLPLCGLDHALVFL